MQTTEMNNEEYSKVTPLLEAMTAAVRRAVDSKGTPEFSAAAIQAARIISRAEDAIYKYRRDVPESVSNSWSLSVRASWAAISNSRDFR